jgi:hypothetical protein
MSGYPSAWVAMKQYGSFSRQELREAWVDASEAERRAMMVVAVYMGWADAPDGPLARLYPRTKEIRHVSDR